MGIWDDDFTGTNGDPPNASLWEVTANPDDEFVIASNQYALSRSTYSSPAQIWTYITKGLFVFDGDFDFQIDVPSKAVSYNNSGGWCYFGLGIETENGDTWELIGFGSYSTIQNRQYAFGSYASGTPEYRVAYSAASSAWGIKLRFVAVRVNGKRLCLGLLVAETGNGTTAQTDIRFRRHRFRGSVRP